MEASPLEETLTPHRAQWLFALFPIAVLPLMRWLQLGPLGFDFLSAFEGIGILALLGLVPAGLLGALGFLAFREKRLALFGFVLSISAVLGLVLGMPMAKAIHRHEFAALANRAKPLTSAIHRYAKDNGRPPETLSVLVPGYLPHVPGTGMRAYPKFEYVSGQKARDRFDNEWAIYVDTPNGLMNWDMFIYHPNGAYETYDYGGVLERIGDWAYVHE